jgi:hypothetical protein
VTQLVEVMSDLKKAYEGESEFWIDRMEDREGGHASCLPLPACLPVLFHFHLID